MSRWCCRGRRAWCGRALPIVNPIGSAAVYLAWGKVSMATPSASSSIASLSTASTCSSFPALRSRAVVFASPLLLADGGGIIVALNGWSLLTKDAQKDRAATPNPEEVLKTRPLPLHLAHHRGPGSISVRSRWCALPGHPVARTLFVRRIFSPPPSSAPRCFASSFISATAGRALPPHARQVRTTS